MLSRISTICVDNCQFSRYEIKMSAAHWHGMKSQGQWDHPLGTMNVFMKLCQSIQ